MLPGRSRCSSPTSSKALLARSSSGARCRSGRSETTGRQRPAATGRKSTLSSCAIGSRGGRRPSLGGVTSWWRGPRTGRPPPEGVHVGGGRCAQVVPNSGELLGPPWPSPRCPQERSIHVLLTAVKSCASNTFGPASGLYRGAVVASLPTSPFSPAVGFSLRSRGTGR